MGSESIHCPRLEKGKYDRGHSKLKGNRDVEKENPVEDQAWTSGRLGGFKPEWGTRRTMDDNVRCQRPFV